MPRELHLSIALDGTGHRPAESRAAAHWTDLIGLAEQGTVDFVTVGGSPAPPHDDSAGRLDPVAVLARAAPLTTRIGLVPAATTTHTEPFRNPTANVDARVYSGIHTRSADEAGLVLGERVATHALRNAARLFGTL
ncbi:hypothetical protein [Streptomyces sp. NPDC096152]|uniref:hypothetical protein n=1 Tax=Streptomyces sp. NPDC096152 TaxID=3366078 RepID=UPI0038234158